jgi:hypothetical protein
VSNNEHRDPLYLFACYIECRRKRNAAAYDELMAALHDSNGDTRVLAEVLRSQTSQRGGEALSVHLTDCESYGLNIP